MDEQVVTGPVAGDLAEDGSIETSAHGRRLALSTLIFAVATAISRVVGLAREILARNYFGVQGAGINAFTAADCETEQCPARAGVYLYSGAWTSKK